MDIQFVSLQSTLAGNSCQYGPIPQLLLPIWWGIDFHWGRLSCEGVRPGWVQRVM